MKAHRKGGSVKVHCSCKEGVMVDVASFYCPGGLSCTTCGEKFQATPTFKPKTHKSSRERHQGHSHTATPKEKTGKEKSGKK